MKRFLIATSIIGALLAFAPGITAQVGAEVALRAAIEQETVKGDLNGAIEQYKKIVARYPDNHAIAARALLRMAGSYEKLGNPEYKNVYARVVAQYADQPEAAQARARLNAKAAAEKPAAGELDEVVWADIKGRSACAPSPDGRFVVCVGVEGNLWRHNLAGGEDRALTSDGSMPDNRSSATFTAGSPGSGYSGASSPQVSSDNKFVAYRWDTDMVRARSLPSLRIVGADGSGQRVLLKGDISPFAWSPDDSRILVGTGKNSLGLVSVADGSMTVTEASGAATPNAFSPDGSQIVYARGEIFVDPQSGLNRGTSSVWVMNAGGGGETQLIGDPNRVWNAGPAMWAPDGRSIVFVSNRSGSSAVWSLAMADGRPQGEPVLLVQSALNIVRLTQDGSVFHTTNTSQTDVYTAGIDPSSLNITSTPQRLNQSHIGAIAPVGLDWSPDGRSLVYTPALGKSFIVNSLDTSAETEVKIPDGVLTTSGFFPDGQTLLAVGTEPGKALFRRIDIRTGDVRTFFQIPADPLGAIPKAALSPDGRSLFYTARTASGVKVIRRDLQTGEENVVYQGYAGYFGVYVSPDGRQVALRPDLVTVPAEGGPVHELLHVGGYGTAWAKDGKRLLFLKGGNPTVVYAVPTDGTDPQPVGLSMEKILGIAMNPGNTRVAFLGNQSRSDLRAYRNLLPPAPAQ